MAAEVTLKTIMEYLSAMERRLIGRLTEVHGRISEVETGLNACISDLGSQMRGMEQRLLVQIDAINKRIENLEFLD